MWFLVRRLLMMFVTAWVVERAVTRWPRLAFVRRLFGLPRLPQSRAVRDQSAGRRRERIGNDPAKFKNI